MLLHERSVFEYPVAFHTGYILSQARWFLGLERSEFYLFRDVKPIKIKHFKMVISHLVFTVVSFKLKLNLLEVPVSRHV